MRKYILLCITAACSAVYAQAQQAVPVSLGDKSFTLVRFLGKEHYRPVTWNDTTSAMLYDKWMEHLDDEQLFFTKADVAALAAYRYKLDDEILSRHTDFFNASVTLYRKRLLLADSTIKDYLSKPADLSKPDNFVWPFTGYAANEQELVKRWQSYLKWQVLDNIADKLTENKKPLKNVGPADFALLEKEARDKVKKRELRYIKNFLSTPADFLSGQADEYLNSIAWCYDPHTNYMNLGAKQEFESETSASEYTLGFDMEENEKGDKTIGDLQPGGSAWRSGKLHKGDVLVKIKTGGTEKNLSETSTEELTGILTGNSNADAEVTVRTAAGEEKTVRLTKEKITADESIVKSYVLRSNKNIGYINLPGFYSREDDNAKEMKDIKYDGSANDVSKEIVKLKKDSIAGLILDLRFNGGGSMWEAMQMAGIFIDIGPVASVKEKDGSVHFLKDPNRGTIYDGPLLVLINGASASASEFVSAVLQDYNRALIAGANTYGKGTAQIVVPLDTNTANPNKNATDFVKVTEQKFYRVNGGTTQWSGVVPDIVFPDFYDSTGYKERANKSALEPDKSKTGIYEALKPLPVAQLRAASEARTAANPYFKTVSQFNRSMSQFKKGQTVPLQWASFIGYYENNLKMYEAVKTDDEDEAAAKSSIGVSNNSFDTKRIEQADTKVKEVNEAYLKHIKGDKTIEEAYKIMMDWTGK